MTEGSKPNQSKKPKKAKEPEFIDYDWRNRAKPRDPEDDLIVDGWRRRADETFERIEEEEEIKEAKKTE